MNIPLAHVQGGEITGSIDEKVRHAVTKLADVHLVSHRAGRRAGRSAWARSRPRCSSPGCPSIDLADRVASDAGAFDPFDLYAGVGHQFSVDQDYVVIMQHPVTTEYLDAAKQIDATLEALARIELPVFFFWPNVDAGSDRISKRIRQFREEHDLPHVYFFKNLPPEDFLRLISRASLRHRQLQRRDPRVLLPRHPGGEHRHAGSTAASGARTSSTSTSSADEIVAALERHLAGRPVPRVHLYGDGKAGERIAEVLATCELSIEKRLTY